MFYLSKIVWTFLQPSSLIAIVLVAGFLSGRSTQASAGLPVLFCGIALYLIAGISPLANWLLIPLETRARDRDRRNLSTEQQGSLSLRRHTRRQKFGKGGVILNTSADRMIEASRLAQQHPDLPVIFSGGSGDIPPSGNQGPEAQLARRFFEGFKIVPPGSDFKIRATRLRTLFSPPS